MIGDYLARSPTVLRMGRLIVCDDDVETLSGDSWGDVWFGEMTTGITSVGAIAKQASGADIEMRDTRLMNREGR
jgi:hypothetical protein